MNDRTVLKQVTECRPLDFSKCVALLDRHRVSFISVREHFNSTDLWEYAKVCRVSNVMRPYLEATL